MPLSKCMISLVYGVVKISTMTITEATLKNFFPICIVFSSSHTWSTYKKNSKAAPLYARR